MYQLSVIRNFNGLSTVGGQYASSCQISSKSVKRLQTYGDLTVLNRETCPPLPLTFIGLKFVQKLVHCCSWLLTETQCKIRSVQHVRRPKLFKNLCLGLVSGVPHFFFRTTPLLCWLSVAWKLLRWRSGHSVNTPVQLNRSTQRHRISVSPRGLVVTTTANVGRRD